MAVSQRDAEEEGEDDKVEGDYDEADEVVLNARPPPRNLRGRGGWSRGGGRYRSCLGPVVLPTPP